MAFDIEHVRCCAVCGGLRNDRKTSIAESIGLMPPLGVVKCVSCGFRWQSPRITESTLMEIYSASYFIGSKPPKSFIDIYEAPPEDTRTFSQESVHQKSMQQRKHLEILQSTGSLTGKHLLEIGCGRGGFLRVAESYGISSTGVEPSSEAVAEARESGLNVLRGTIGELPDEIRGLKWDIIYMSHVFEHIYDPVDAISIVSSLLSEDGYVFIEVPNQFDSWTKIFTRTIRMILKISRASTIYSIHHTTFFNLKNLRRMFVDRGFEVIGGSWTPRRTNVLTGPLFSALGMMAAVLSDQGENIYILAKKSIDDGPSE